MKQPANLFVNKEEENTFNEVAFECRDRSIAVMYRENYNPVDWKLKKIIYLQMCF